MPVEIKELVIRAVVGGNAEQTSEAPAGQEATAELVQACVREVLRVLKQSKER